MSVFQVRAETNNKCELSSAKESTLSQYAKSRDFNVAGLLSECLRDTNTQQKKCKQTVIKELPGMTIQYQDTWRTTEKTKGKYDFTKFDEAINFAKANGIKLHFFHLIWTSGKDNSYVPKWLFTNHNCGTWTRLQLLEIMKTHIQETMRHGGDTVAVWNVVNEAFMNADGAMANNCFKSIIGSDYIDKAFKYAHEVAPNAILVLNDAFGRDRMTEVGVSGFFDYVKGAKNRGIPIDAVGLQNHLISETGEQFSEGYLQDLDNYFIKARDANVKVLITEMDVYQAKGYSQEDVVRLYKNVTAMCLKYNNCISLGTWGISDKYSWARLPQYANLPDAKPLLFDDNYKRKTAYYGVMEAIKENTSRPCVVVPTSIPVPGACTECPKTFSCYQNGTVYKWYATGMPKTGFTKVDDSKCTGINKPTFKGKIKGDADCTGIIDLEDVSIWRAEYISGNKGEVKKNNWLADFNCLGTVDLVDRSIWRDIFIKGL